MGCILKLYGKIDAEKLLQDTGNTKNPRADVISVAAKQLNDLLLHGAILADDVGLGKTKQALLVGYLHTLLYDARAKDDPSKLQHQPILLVVPSTLINQWLAELRECWPCYTIMVSYSDYAYKSVMTMNDLSYSTMKDYPSLESIPSHLRYIFDNSDPRARKVIVVTTYETHKLRTATKMTRKIPGVPFKKMRYDEKGQVIWKKPPRTENYYITNQSNVYSLMIADEAQKIKNISTGLWSVLYLQSFPKTLLCTATPMHNSVKVRRCLH